MTRDGVVLGGGRLLLEDVVVDVRIAGGRIASVGSDSTAPGGEDIDVTGFVLAPGFIELQINGAFGHDFTTDPATIWKVGARLPEWGVTAFAPTLVSTGLDAVRHAQEVVTAGPPRGYRGATVLGLHVEGPFLAPTRAGAHDPSKLRHPAPDLVDGWSPAAGIRIVTVAPELPGAIATVQALAASGVVVSAGHSEASYDEAMAGFAAGITLVTHLFNAMSGIEHRNPGLAAAALAHPSVVAGLIADGHHVHAGAIRAARAALGPRRILLVTDAIAATAAPHAGTLGSIEIASVDDVPRTAAGVLAGSLLTLDAAVRRYVDLAGVAAGEAVAAVTSTPAAVVGLDDRGAITQGAVADVTVLDDDLGVVATIIGGEVVHGAARLASDGRIGRETVS